MLFFNFSSRLHADLLLLMMLLCSLLLAAVLLTGCLWAAACVVATARFRRGCALGMCLVGILLRQMTG